MREKWKQWQTIFSWAPKSLQRVTAAMKLKDAYSLEEKNYDKPRQCIKKQRHHFADKVHLVKVTIFLVVIYRCESWTINKADAFELWCWRRLLRVPWTARRSNQSILKEITHEHSLKGLILKLQYFGHLMRRADSLEKTLILGNIETGGKGGDRGWDGSVASLTQWTWVWATSRR